MTPEAAKPLQEHIGRREVGDDEVSVDVHALFDDLGGDQNAAGGPAVSILAQAAQPKALKLVPAELGKAGMEQRD